MSEAKHSPAPWTACKDGSCVCGQVWSGGDKHIATAHRVTQEGGDVYAEWDAEEQAANAQLIASAPALKAENERLRAALEGLYTVMRERHYGRMPPEVQDAYDKAGAALRGEVES